VQNELATTVPGDGAAEDWTQDTIAVEMPEPQSTEHAVHVPTDQTQHDDGAVHERVVAGLLVVQKESATVEPAEDWQTTLRTCWPEQEHALGDPVCQL